MGQDTTGRQARQFRPRYLQGMVYSRPAIHREEKFVLL